MTTIPQNLHEMSPMALVDCLDSNMRHGICEVYNRFMAAGNNEAAEHYLALVKSEITKKELDFGQLRLLRVIKKK
jgi:hypothetical protein